MKPHPLKKWQDARRDYEAAVDDAWLVFDDIKEANDAVRSLAFAIKALRDAEQGVLDSQKDL